MKSKTFTNCNIIFGGGGVKGIAYLGALYALEQNGFKINKVGGTSVGAIIASLIIMGYNSIELIQLLKEINLENYFKKYKINKFSKVLKNQGLVSSESIYNLLKPLYLKKQYWYYKDVIKNNQSYLKVTTTKLKPKIKEIIIPDDLNNLNINKEKFPIIDSVIMSSAYPIYFTPYKMNNQIFIDGGIKERINLTLFKNEPLLLLAFSLCKNPKELYKKINNGYLININTNDIKVLDFKITIQEIKNLLNIGYQTVIIWIQNEWTNIKNINSYS